MKFFTFTLVTLMSFLIFTTPVVANDTNSEQQFTVYLVRHAEKVLTQKNPPLTPCGVKRAEQLSVMLEQAKIKTIYSTKFVRTEQTAAPLAKKLNIQVQSYSPRDLKAFASKIKQAKNNTVIVGHSNTTPQLTALIANTLVKEITEQEYQMLYQVQFTGDNAQLTLLKQPLSCQ
ncbi:MULTISPECIES: phosphoglycerate mutase family protein [Thalassotalea]|uniref:Phosphoglycerate mutase family protein n=1 Tax=Thalassotalea castellviae TaxID=3075612 RepID=A0ABU3A739_9GAMM|nr:phosphoglycerate mutase family protein [Thalassotalea sp. W431]MDT0604918.1 phosphoglycerate mutase family protein [Thalassotalea sp. W431]